MEILGCGFIFAFCLICRVNPVVVACIFYLLARGL